MARTLLLVFGLCATLFSVAEMAVPALTGRVTDQTETLTQGQIQALDQALQAFEASKGSQIAILIVPSTQPETIEQYSIRVAEQWKLGRAKIDDGAILIVAKNDRTLRIEVGYGLEGALSDAVSKRIISEVIVPYFRKGDFYGGIAAGVERMMAVISGEPLPAPSRGEGAGKLGQLGPTVLILAVIVSSALRAILGRLPGAVVAAAVVGFIAWWMAGLLTIAIGAALVTFVFGLTGGMAGLGRGGVIGGHYGGGFRGGGGGFGGGGASGRW